MKKRILLAIVLLSIVGVSAQIGDYSSSYQTIGSSTNVQYYQPGISGGSGWTPQSVYWPQLDRETCRQRQDFIVQISPGGCRPAVVRSDLLEEQDVPVFCKLTLVQTNPLIDVSRVKSINFIGDRPEGVAGITYFPPRYNIYTRNDLADTPIDDNMGYFVLKLRRTPREDDMPDWIEGNLTAQIYYDVEDALGIGRTSFYVSELKEEEWLRDYKFYSFWNGKAYLRPESIESDRVTVSIYRDMDTREGTVTLKKGETSSPIYLGGYYCASGIKVRLEDITVPEESALLQIGESQTWVRKDDRIIGDKCKVEEVDATPGTGKVRISCPVSDGRFDLKLYSGKAELSVDEGGMKDYSINSQVADNVYLAYVGTYLENKETKKFVVLVADPLVNSEIGFENRGLYAVIDKVVANNKLGFESTVKQIQEAIVKEYKNQLNDDSVKPENISVVSEEGAISGHAIKLSQKGLIKNKEWLEDDEEYIYYQKAIQSYTDLVELYPDEKRLDDDYFEPYGAEALYKAALLAQEFGMYEDREKFYAQLRRDYPDSGWLRTAEEDIQRLLKYDTEESRALVNLRDGSYFVQVLDFQRPTKNELGVDLSINGIQEDRLGLNEIFSLKGEEKGQTIQVTKITQNTVELVYNKPADGDKTSITKTETLDLDKKNRVSFESVEVRLLNINYENQAKIVLDSELQGPRAYANFSYKIGIEKRGIQLSPEKTQEMMENVEETIEEWEDINERLGKVVKGLKGACFATSAVLTAKNLLTGFSGDSMARSELMTMSGGWNDKCEKLVSEGKYYNIQACLLDNNDKIEGDIGVYSQAIQGTNEKLEQARHGLVEGRDILDFEKQVTDRDAMEEKFRNLIDCNSLETTEFKEDPCKDLNFDDLKQLYTLQNAKNAGGSEVLTKALGEEQTRIEEQAQMTADWDKAKEASTLLAKSNGWTNLRRTNSLGDSLTPAFIETVPSKKRSIVAGADVMMYFIPVSYLARNEPKRAPTDGKIGGQDIIIGLDKDPKTNTYTYQDDFYMLDGTALNCEDGDKEDCAYIKDYLASQKAFQFIKSDAKAYQNRIDNSEDLMVKYFDRAPYKGLPAEVPFDVDNGWYVEMEYILSGFGKPYDESGRLVNFYICNVGSNNKIDFKRNADDICRYYNGISDELGFPGMSSTESRTLVTRAKQAVTEASKYYGKEEAYINGHKFDTGISFGGEGGRCTDFMPASDCNILFNVCDPVICPASRCDLGGNFPVDNVIQTGIIGSLVLCLPNLQEGIYVPVCLSGVHAGIEGYLSILRAHRDCLNESLVTGKTIGICDEIRSIYLCEFFWKQMVPFMDVLLPRLIESFFNQGARGGGEYLTVESAWDNTQKSIDFFTDEYAVNSMEAFQMRSTEEAGTEICKSFVSTRYPTDFDLLTEPDSPVQYHAWFEENIMTTATPYSTSHYKVYYHIYAGNDQGSYYTVYLRGIPEDSASQYMYQSDYIVVPESRGYIPAGQHVDVTRDFTAPSGYKELCVNINGQDECGFGKVSTSFAVNYITDKYVQDQMEQEITSSEDCVAGTPSVYSLAQPNLQAGVEETIQPELYNKGITRVCSTYNPGRQVDGSGQYDTANTSYDRWKDVGYCDDKSLRCWVDTESVKDVVQDKGLETQALDEVDTSVIGAMGYLEYDAAKSIDKEYSDVGTRKFSITSTSTEQQIQKEIEDIEEDLQKLAELSPSNSYRARGLLLLGKLYGRAASLAKGSDTEKENNKGNPKADQSIQLQTPQGSQENENENDDYKIGDKVKSVVTGEIWIKQDNGRWKNGNDLKSYDELGYVVPYVEPEESEENGEDEEESEESLEESVRVSVKYGLWDIVGKNPEIDVESYRIIGMVKFVKNKETDEVYVSTDLNSEKFDGEWKIATKAQKTIYENEVKKEGSSSVEETIEYTDKIQGQWITEDKIATFVTKDGCCDETIKNARYDADTITYSIQDCHRTRKINIESAINFINENTKKLTLYKTSEKPKITIICKQSGTSTGGGQTSLFLSSSGGSTQKSIEQATSYSYTDFPSTGIVEMHELLHALGFDHSTNQESIMFAQIKLNGDNILCEEGSCSYLTTNGQDSIVYVGQEILNELDSLYS